MYIIPFSNLGYFIEDTMNNDLYEGDDLCNKAMDAYEQSRHAANVIQIADNKYVPNISPGPSKHK